MKSNRSYRVIGTAGHVDHGKSALVKAITGMDPDRLKEEKEREMTIDLGFAWMTLPSGLEVSIVDVPGHEDFIKNMLAGVGAIDAALLVVAADEGIMPQTREHLAILDLLGVKRGLVALTKTDLVEDEEWLALVTSEIGELLRETGLAASRVVGVSSQTKKGLEDLLKELDRLLLATPPRTDLGRPRLPIDRAFSIAGFGTVVTGTLVDGQLSVGQEVEILPQGLRARIRGLQTHKEGIGTAPAGSRVAANLTGVGVGDLGRGDVLTDPGWLHPTQLLDVHLRLLADVGRPLGHNAWVDFYSGAAQVPARIRVLGAKAIESGGEGWAQLSLSRPTAVVAQDRFIIRQPSPSLTLGGGQVLDPHPRGRYRRTRVEVLNRLEALASGKPDDVVSAILAQRGPMVRQELLGESGLVLDVASEALRRLLDNGEVLALGDYVVPAREWDKTLDELRGIVGDYHRLYPLRRGMPKEELKSRLGYAPRLFNAVIDQAVRRGGLLEERASIRLRSHKVRFSPQEEESAKRLLAVFVAQPYNPPSIAQCHTLAGPEVLAALIEEGALIRVGDGLVFSAQAYERMRDGVVEAIGAEGSITLAQVRDMFQTSRKYAQAILEYLDGQGITKRVGDARVLR